VVEEKRFTYPEILALPRKTIKTDFHCVTGWSRYDNEWEGVGVMDLLRAAGTKLQPDVRYVLVHSENGYTTNLSVQEFITERNLFAFRHDGKDLSPDHGYPLRLVVPDLYGWKSAKWVRGVEFLAKNVRGFWESNGYHNHADPWKEERYSYQELE
jgi:DMSO/TMAO reductase YedYZ molybdopterin-dependent catalytic subunit